MSKAILAFETVSNRRTSFSTVRPHSFGYLPNSFSRTLLTNSTDNCVLKDEALMEGLRKGNIMQSDSEKGTCWNLILERDVSIMGHIVGIDIESEDSSNLCHLIKMNGTVQ